MLGRMGLFDTFKKKPTATLATVLETHLGRSLEKIFAMQEKFRTRKVTDLVPSEGRLTLDGTTLPVQYLGAMGNVEGEWQWADDEDAANVPLRALDASKRVLALGRSLGIRELGAVRAGAVHVDVVTLIAMGVGELSGRVEFPQQDVTFWFGLESGAVPVPRPDALRMSRVMTSSMRLLEYLPFDPIAAFRHYATSYGMKLRDTRDGVIADVAPGQTCSAVVAPPDPEMARVLPPGVVGYSFAVNAGPPPRA